MGVEIALIALLAGLVHGHIGDHAARGDLLGDEGPHQRAPLLKVQLMGQRQQQFARRHRVLAALAPFGGVPQRLPIAVGRRGVVRRQDFAELDPGLAGEIELHRQALVGQRLAGPIGCGGHRRAARGALDGLNLHQERGHRLTSSYRPVAGGIAKGNALGSSDQQALA